MGELFPHLGKRTEQQVDKVLAARPRGLFTDIDGTISGIAPTPEAATLLPGIAPLLQQARASFDLVAAVSGRAAQDAARLVGNPYLLYIGNHGFEWYQPESGLLLVAPAARPLVAALEAVMNEVGPALQQRWPGLRIESKGVTASVHLRGTSAPAAALEDVYQTLTAQASRTGGLEVTRGRMVVELRPDLDIDKGSAITEVIRERNLRSAVYLGDDRTDLDAFRALHRLAEEGSCQGLTVAVRNDEAVAEVAAEADLVIPDIEQVPDFLRWLLAR